MKKLVFPFLALILILSLCGCNLFRGHIDIGHLKESNYYPNTEWFTGPASTRIYENGTSAETDYSNIEAYTSNAVYPLDFEKITYTVKDNNPGKYFKIWGGVWLELYDSVDWERTGYMLIDSNCALPPTWRTISDTDESGCCASVRELSRKDLIGGFDGKSAEPLTAGRYRLAIYAGWEMVYAEFEFE